MRISDWSSDVCSSDLPAVGRECEPDQLAPWLAVAGQDALADGIGAHAPPPFKGARKHERVPTLRFSVSLGRFRIRVLPGFDRGFRWRRLVLEPVRAGGHDDLVALLVGEPVFGEHAALVLGPVARFLAAARLDALLLDEFVGRQIGEIVECLDPRLAERDEHRLGQIRHVDERILDDERRSEASGVGRGGVRTVWSRWSPYTFKKTINHIKVIKASTV